MVKLVDTLGSGSSGGNAVEVQVLFRATKAGPLFGGRLLLYWKEEDLNVKSRRERLATAIGQGRTIND